MDPKHELSSKLCRGEETSFLLNISGESVVVSNTNIEVGGISMFEILGENSPNMLV